ncbi:Uncharacterized protein Fot_04069 [Forsythia ovata]|uniref:Uncharacterized protein n=1 Tax=Forsythia ovata TaxID=205694 RepID=A0ABD1XCD9_9LAMI
MKGVGVKTTHQKRRSALLQQVMRPQKNITIDEIDEPNFDLGIDSQPNANCLLLHDGLVLIEEGIKMIDLDGMDNTLVASFDPVEQGGNGSSPKPMKIDSIEQCSGLNTLDDDLVFSKEDLIFNVESAEQHRFDVRDTNA